jgi:hypothetical protein
VEHFLFGQVFQVFHLRACRHPVTPRRKSDKLLISKLYHTRGTPRKIAFRTDRADDVSLCKLADRIQSRAIRRCGESLKQFDWRPQNAAKTK